MYETSFGFTARPFAAAPQSICYYASGPVESARKTIVECIERAEGPALLVGPPGVGKSLVCHRVAEHFDDQLRVVLLADGRISSRKELLQNILFDLGLTYQDIDEGELRLSLIDYLDPRDAQRAGMLLIIDEADTLSVELLEEIRMITNLVRDGKPRVRLLLAGGPELETLFASPKLETFNQRIARRCYLHNLNEQQTAEYVRAQISGVGGDAQQVFTDDAIASIFTASDGSPRFINQLCDHALLLNSVSGDDSVNAESISDAWSDLQQLPAPWDDAEPEEPTPSFIEFGELAAEDPTGTEATSEVGEQAIGQIDAIQQEVDRIVEHETAASEEPPAETEPAATVDTPLATEAVEEVDPFGEEFEEEEEVIDPHNNIAAALASLAKDISIDDASDEVASISQSDVQAEEAPDQQWDEPTDVELDADSDPAEAIEATHQTEAVEAGHQSEEEHIPAAEETADTAVSHEAPIAASEAADEIETEALATDDSKVHEAQSGAMTTLPAALIGSSLPVEQPAADEAEPDDEQPTAEAAFEADHFAVSSMDEAGSINEVADEAPAIDEEQTAASEDHAAESVEVSADAIEDQADAKGQVASAAGDDSTFEAESTPGFEVHEEATSSFDEEPAEATSPAEAMPMQTVQLGSNEMPMMGLGANPDPSDDLDEPANADESELATDNEGLASESKPAPIHTVQLDAGVISQSIEASHDEIFSVDTDAEPPALITSDEPVKDEFFLIDSDDNESDSKAEPISPSGETVDSNDDELEDMFAVGSDDEPTSPGQWPLAGPIDEQIEPIAEDEVAGESMATNVAFHRPVDELAESLEATDSAAVEPAAEAVEAEEPATPSTIDDRDMIVVEEPKEDEVPENDQPRARRQEYRQLFARLRKSQ